MAASAVVTTRWESELNGLSGWASVVMTQHEPDRACNLRERAEESDMIRLHSYAAVLGVLVASCGSGSTLASPFVKHCAMPYNDTAKKRSIDSTCSAPGEVDPGESPTLRAAHEEQNRVKNELCDTGAAKNVTFKTFGDLQKAVDDKNVTYGSRTALPDRSELRDLQTDAGTLSEGDVVRLEGFVEHAKKGSGESCNCGRTKVLETDIHIHLTAAEDDARCKSIIAEMTPHYRPTAWHWTHLRDMEGWYVRVTGQLFFDGSHRPCQNPQHSSSDPARQSEWEIHPVYKFEVCMDEHCDAQSSWLPISDWIDSVE